MGNETEKLTQTENKKEKERDPIKVLTTVLVTFCLAFFGLAVIFVWLKSLNLFFGDRETAPYLTHMISGVSALLTTNLGAVLGLSTVKEDSPFKVSKNWNPLNHDGPAFTKFQINACYVYLFALIGSMLVWCSHNFETDPNLIEPLIPEFGKSLWGVMAGIMGALLAPLKTR